jgi:hypothetical protein
MRIYFAGLQDFLRKNNTGKLLWQVFGDKAARLTVCGVQEQEEAMWKVFEQAGLCLTLLEP